MSFNKIEENIIKIQEKIDNDDTLVKEKKEEIKERINNLTIENLFETIVFINKTKNKFALDILNEKIVAIITPQISNTKPENEFYNENDFIHIFRDGLLKSNGQDSKSKQIFIKKMNDIIEEYQVEYLSEKFDSNMLYYRLGKTANSFKCNTIYNKSVLPNYINILTCICAFNKKKIIEEEYTKLIKSVIMTLYKCFGIGKGLAETGRALFTTNAADVKLQKAKIAGIIVCYKDMIMQNICSIKEMALIQKNTYYLESIYGKLQSMVAPLSVAIFAIGVTFVIGAIDTIPGVTAITKFPLYVTPILSVIGAVTGTQINQSFGESIKTSLKNMEDKANTKIFFKDYIQQQNIEIEKTNTQCKDGYVEFIKKFRDYATLVNINYDYHYLKQNIYCQLHVLLCKTETIYENDIKNTPNISNDEVNEKYTRLADELEDLYIRTNDRKNGSEKYIKFLSKLNEIKESLQLNNCTKEIHSKSKQLIPLLTSLREMKTENYDERRDDVITNLCQPNYIKGGKRTKKKYMKKLYKRRTWSRK